MRKKPRGAFFRSYAVATALRNVAASVRSAASLAGSPTFECNITFEVPIRGSPCAAEGTNTKDEKPAYIAAMFKQMGELLGPLHHESYLHVGEVRSDAYGFGGLTQERRYIAGKLEAAPHNAAA